MLKILSYIAYASIVITLLNCKGSDGDTGAVGPKGDTGIQGPKGDTVNNTALVYSSGTDTTDALGYFSWTLDNQTEEDLKFWNSATIFVFIKSSGVYWPIPGNINFGENDDSSLSYNFGIVNKSISAEITQTNWTGKATGTLTPPIRIVEDVRIVAVPGVIMRVNAHVNWQNYDQTIAALGLNEKDVRILKKSVR